MVSVGNLPVVYTALLAVEVHANPVVGVGYHRHKARHEGFGLVRTHLAYETGDGELAGILLLIGEKGHQAINKPFLHLVVGEPQLVFPELRIVAFNGEVAALVEHRHGVLLDGVDAAQQLCRHLAVEVVADLLLGKVANDGLFYEALVHHIALFFSKSTK